MKQQEDNIISVVGTILIIAIIGSVVCGMLECFGLNTGMVGGALVIIPIIFMVGFVIWQIIRKINR
jgi:hypothetical protein